jgi:hypothetical protein
MLVAQSDASASSSSLNSPRSASIAATSPAASSTRLVEVWRLPQGALAADTGCHSVRLSVLTASRMSRLFLAA